MVARDGVEPPTPAFSAPPCAPCAPLAISVDSELHFATLSTSISSQKFAIHPIAATIGFFVISNQLVIFWKFRTSWNDCCTDPVILDQNAKVVWFRNARFKLFYSSFHFSPPESPPPGGNVFSLMFAPQVLGACCKSVRTMETRWGHNSGHSQAAYLPFCARVFSTRRK